MKRPLLATRLLVLHREFSLVSLRGTNSCLHFYFCRSRTVQETRDRSPGKGSLFVRIVFADVLRQHDYKTWLNKKLKRLNEENNIRESGKEILSAIFGKKLHQNQRKYHILILLCEQHRDWLLLNYFLCLECVVKWTPVEKILSSQQTLLQAQEEAVTEFLLTKNTHQSSRVIFGFCSFSAFCPEDEKRRNLVFHFRASLQTFSEVLSEKRTFLS